MFPDTIERLGCVTVVACHRAQLATTCPRASMAVIFAGVLVLRGNAARK
jgi:hypothetical protein